MQSNLICRYTLPSEKLFLALLWGGLSGALYYAVHLWRASCCFHDLAKVAKVKGSPTADIFWIAEPMTLGNWTKHGNILVKKGPHMITTYHNQLKAGTGLPYTCRPKQFAVLWHQERGQILCLWTPTLVIGKIREATSTLNSTRPQNKGNNVARPSYLLQTYGKTLVCKSVSAFRSCSQARHRVRGDFWWASVGGSSMSATRQRVEDRWVLSCRHPGFGPSGWNKGRSVWT